MRPDLYWAQPDSSLAFVTCHPRISAPPRPWMRYMTHKRNTWKHHPRNAKKPSKCQNEIHWDMVHHKRHSVQSQTFKEGCSLNKDVAHSPPRFNMWSCTQQGLPQRGLRFHIWSTVICEVNLPSVAFRVGVEKRRLLLSFPNGRWRINFTLTWKIPKKIKKYQENCYVMMQYFKLYLSFFAILSESEKISRK